jgi:hypothetical protein
LSQPSPQRGTEISRVSSPDLLEFSPEASSQASSSPPDLIEFSPIKSSPPNQLKIQLINPQLKSVTPQTTKTTQIKEKVKAQLAKLGININGDSGKYDIIEVPGDGNCFFTAYVRALYPKNTDKEVVQDINNIRKDISKSVTQDYFQLLKQREGLDDYKFMENIPNLKHLQNYILLKDFYADEWSISYIEEHDNVSFIIIEELATSVLIKRIPPTKILSPIRYIMLKFSETTDGKGHKSGHYDLITYNNRTTFSFFLIPEEIKQLVKTQYPNFTTDFVNLTLKPVSS